MYLKTTSTFEFNLSKHGFKKRTIDLNSIEKPPQQLPVKGVSSIPVNNLLLYSFENNLFFLRFGPNGCARLDRAFQQLLRKRVFN